jgi:transcription antitermination factor NusG
MSTLTSVTSDFPSLQESSFTSESLSPHEAGDWYAVYTRHQHEKVAAISLSKKGFEVFLPLYREIRQWKDRRKELLLPLFPCYVFLRGDVDRRSDILSTPGIHSLICVGNDVASVPDAELEPIRRIISNQLQSEPCASLQCGDHVVVKSGPLAGIRGVLLRKKDRLRLVLSVNLLHRGVAVEVDESSVERVDASRFILMT